MVKFGPFFNQFCQKIQNLDHGGSSADRLIQYSDNFWMTLEPLYSYLFTISYLTDVVIFIMERYISGVVHVSVEDNKSVHHAST